MMRGVFTRSNYSCSKTLQVFTISLSTAVCCMRFECLTSTDLWLVDILSANQECCLVYPLGNRVKKPSWDWIQVFFFLPINAPRPLLPSLVVGQGFTAISHFTNHKRKTHQKEPVERWAKICFPENSLNYWLQKSHCL